MKKWKNNIDKWIEIIYEKAEKNIKKWGLQPIDELLLASMEELGELTRAYLRSKFENGDSNEIDSELDDLAALIIQIKLGRCE
ncbi:MAG: hypothetical protein ACTSRP_09155 [Candidatus Helarchaeota archaeon]